MSLDFATHTGPVVRPTDGDGLRFTLRLEQHHLNFANRFHGGMVMSLHIIAMSQVAIDIARRAGPSASAPLLSLNCDFIGAATFGADVEAEVSVSRVTRSVVFLSCRLRAGEQILSTASAIHKLQSAPIEPAAPPCSGVMPDGWSTEQGWSLVTSKEPFGKRVGPLFERLRPDGIAVARFEVAQHLTDPHRLGLLHCGMLLYVADIFLGRLSSRTAARSCVTLSMSMRRYADAVQGEFVDFVPTPQVDTPSVLFADGQFHSGGRLLMSVSSAWKVLGAP